jgi:hypothetical protein
MLTRNPFLAALFQKEIPTMKTILTGVILAGLLAVAGCSQSVEQPAATGSNGADTPATTGHNGNMGPGHMSGGQEHGPGHQDGHGQP